MHKLHNQLPAVAPFLADDDFLEICAALDTDESKSLTSDEFQGLCKEVFGGYWGSQKEMTFKEFKAYCESMHRKYPSLGYVDKLAEWLQKKTGKVAETVASAGNPSRRALLVGINYIGTPNELHGCINDMKLHVRLLKEHYGFDDGEICLLTDDQEDRGQWPTAANIKFGMDWLLQDTKPGDIRYWAYSGHGTQVQDPTGEEADGENEAICPLDCNSAPWPKRLIVDDYVRKKFWEQLPEGVLFTAIFDCCHSGTIADLRFSLDADGSREFSPAAQGGKPRYMPPPPGLAVTREGAPRAARAICEPREAPRGGGKPRKLWVISGCQDSQTSADATIDGLPQGACTWALMKALRDYKYDATYRDLVEAARLSLRQSQYSQVPGLACESELGFKEIFISGKGRQPKPGLGKPTPTSQPSPDAQPQPGPESQPPWGQVPAFYGWGAPAKPGEERPFGLSALLGTGLFAVGVVFGALLATLVAVAMHKGP